MSDSIKVVCRLRPLNKIQIANQGQQCVTFSEKQINITVGGQQNKHTFVFDRIFGPNTQQVSIYKEVATPIIKSVISGFNGTVFAYGQTGGGKTWTMEGPNHHDPEFKGLIPRTIEGLFQSIAQCDESLEFVVKGSYVQIYNQKLFDLLDRKFFKYSASKARLQIKQDKQRGIFIQNCTQISVSSAQQMLKTMDSGSQNRKVAFTGMNERSSRSHSLFIIHIHQRNLKKDNTKQSKLYFVDLAGSEKVSKTNVMGQQLQQAKNINKSLSALGNVINALTSDKKQHVPYRDSKLTRILQQSLGGNSKTTLIINCSMCTYNDKQTLSTLRFGYRAKSIKNKPKVNEQKSAKQLFILLQAANKTINQLKAQLKMPNEHVSQQHHQDPKDIQISELKTQIQNNKNQQLQRSKQMQTRIKQLLLQLSKQKDDKNISQSKWSGIFFRLHNYLIKIAKYIRRSYVDLQFCLNNVILHVRNNQINVATLSNKQAVESTLKNIEQFQKFFKLQLNPICQQIAKKEQIEQQQNIKNHLLTPDKRKNKIALSQPTLYFNSQFKKQIENSKMLVKQDESYTNMSCIVQNFLNPYEENGSDKISQSENSQIQTMLQSFQTKQSQRVIMEEMATNIKQLKKQNQQLNQKIQKMIKQRQNFAIILQQKYEQKILQLDQRVHQYKYIMSQKDIQLTQYFEDTEKLQKTISQQKVVIERLKKVIQNNSNLKSFHDMQEKMRSLASQRQKIFNQMYTLRQQLDEAQMTIRQKDQHIQSLKSVMKELNQNISLAQFHTQQQITKSYNNQIFGTQTPNVVQAIKGGGGSKQAKKSSLRRKTVGLISAQPTNPVTPELAQKKELSKQTKPYLPFLKSFFQ